MPDFHDLDGFTRAYVTAALWSSTDDQGEPLDGSHGPDDIAPDTLQRMANDCAAFQRDNATLLERAYRCYPAKEWSPQEQAGHDLWLTRNGHGTGFWDRGIGPVGDHLTEKANAMASFYLYVGDDNMIHGS